MFVISKASTRQNGNLYVTVNMVTDVVHYKTSVIILANNGRTPGNRILSAKLVVALVIRGTSAITESAFRLLSFR